MILQSQFARHAPSVAIVAVLALVHPDAVFAVFVIGHIEAFLHVFAVTDVIAGDILIAKSRQGLVRERARQIIQLCAGIFKFRSVRQQCLPLFLIFLLRAWFIENVIRLIHEIYAPDAVLTAAATFQQERVRAIAAIFRVEHAITFIHIDAFVAGFAIEREEAIHRAVIAMEICAVVAVFIVVAGKDKIAVSVSLTEIRVIGIIILKAKVEGRQWYGMMQIIPLLKERTVPVDVFSVCHWIPDVGVPHVGIVDREWFLRRVDGEDRFFGMIACASIERFFVAPRQSSLSATGRTVRRRWNQELLIRDHRREEIIESQILLRDSEELMAMCAIGHERIERENALWCNLFHKLCVKV